MGRLSTFKKGFASTFGFNVVGKGLSALTLVVLLRSLSTSEFAFIVLLLNVGQFLGSAATGGIRLRYARLEAERVSRGHEDPSAFHSALFSGTLLVVAAGLLGFLGATALGLASNGHERLVFAALTTGFTLVTASIEMAIFHYQAQLAFVRAGVLEVARSGAIFVLSLGAAVGLLETGAAVALAFDLGVGALALGVTVPLALSTRGAQRGREGRFGFGPETAMLTVYSLASAGWAYLDVFLVAALLNDVAVASYGAALRYISVVIGPMPALVAIFRVRTAQHDMIDSEGARRRMMGRWVKQVFWPALAITAVAGVAATWAIPLVDGGRYPLSVSIFQIVLVIAFVSYLLLPAPGLLIAQKRYTTLAWVNAGALLVNVALAVVAAPLIGVLGVAVAAAVCGVGQAVTVAYLALRPPRRPSVEVGDGDLAAVGSEGAGEGLTRLS